MKSISLEDAKKLPITSLYLAVVKEPISQDQISKVLQLISEGTPPSEYFQEVNDQVDNLTQSLKESFQDRPEGKATSDFNKVVDEIAQSLNIEDEFLGMNQSAPIFADILKRLVFSSRNVFSTTFLAKTEDDEWINLGPIDIDLVRGTITQLEPLSNYYKENEYGFLVFEDRPVIVVKNVEPYIEFKRKHLSKDEY